MHSKKASICNLVLLLVLSSGLMAQNVSLSSHPHPSLDYPIRVVEAEPYLRPGTNMRQEGDFKAVYRKLGVLPAERMRLPVPGSTWRLDGRVGRTKDGTIYAGFGTYLYWSKDEGKTWTGKRLQGLPNTQKEAVSAQAFGVAGQYIYVAHRASGLPPLTPGDVENPAVAPGKHKLYPLVISRSRDGGKTWESSEPLAPPSSYMALAGDGNSIIVLGDGTLLAALDAYNPDFPAEQAGRSAQIFFRSTDQGKTWGNPTIIPDRAAETGLLSLGGLRVMAAIRGIPNSRLGGKTVQLADSNDGGRTWKNFRTLNRVFGQAHCDLALLPGGGVVAVYENRYPYAEGGDVRARISWDGGRSWEPELYILMKGHGYAGSVAAKDGAIITVAGDGQIGRDGRPTGRGYTLQAMRWRPRDKSGKIVHDQ